MAPVIPSLLSTALPRAGLAVSVLSASLLSVPAPVTANETCWTMGPAQFSDAIHFCVSSVLPPSGGITYGPANLADGNPSTAWCVKGNGTGETITIRMEGGPPFRRLLINNGYAKSDRTYHDNARIKTVEITADSDLHVRTTLADRPGEQQVNLAGMAHHWIKLQVIDIYPGERSADTCLDFISPDYVYEEELLQQQSSPSIAPPREQAPPAPERRPAAGQERPETVPDLPPTPGATDNAVPARDCLTSGATISGRLELYEATHPAGHAMRSYHVVLPEARCVIADDGRIDAARRLQLVPSQEQADMLKSKIGGLLAVRGKFFTPHTAWHTGDVIVVDPSFEP